MLRYEAVFAQVQRSCSARSETRTSAPGAETAIQEKCVINWGGRMAVRYAPRTAGLPQAPGALSPPDPLLAKGHMTMWPAVGKEDTCV